MENDESCLGTSLVHQYEFVEANTGACRFVCIVCGLWVHEWEDSQP